MAAISCCGSDSSSCSSSSSSSCHSISRVVAAAEGADTGSMEPAGNLLSSRRASRQRRHVRLQGGHSVLRWRSRLFLLAAAGCRAAAQDVSAAAPMNSGDTMCQCDLKNNNWVYQIEALLTHVQDLPSALQDEQHPATAWVLSQSCQEDGSTYPNTEIEIDNQDVANLQAAAQFPSSGGRLEVQELCFPGQVAMAVVCAQQWLVKKSLMGLIKWVGRMNELLAVTQFCIDSDTPVPMRAWQFKEYLARFQGGIPPPDHESWISSLAWPYKAELKNNSEAPQPLRECLPLKDAACFPRNTGNHLESCAECCNPKHGTTGNVECWQGAFDYERCCNSPEKLSQVEEAVQTTALGESEQELALAENSELSSKTDTLEEDLRGCNEAKALAVKEDVAKQEKLALLEAQLSKLQSQAEHEVQASSTASEATEKLQAELEKVKAENQKLQSHEASLTSLQANLETAKEENRKLQDDQASCEKEKEEKRELQESKDASLKSLQAELEKAQEETRNSQGNQDDSLKSLQAELEAAREETRKLQESQAKLETEKDEAQKLQESNKADLQKAKEEILTLQETSKAELQKAKEETLKLQESSKASEAELEKAKSEKQKHEDGSKASLEEVRAELEKAKVEKQKLEESSKASLEAVKAELEKAKEEKEKLEASSKASLEAVRAELEKAKVEKQKLEESSKAALEKAQVEKQKLAESSKASLETARAELEKTNVEKQKLEESSKAELKLLREKTTLLRAGQELCDSMNYTTVQFKAELTKLLGFGPPGA